MPPSPHGALKRTLRIGHVEMAPLLESQERLARLGAEPVTGASPEQFAATVKADSARWARLIKDRKITLE